LDSGTVGGGGAVYDCMLYLLLDSGTVGRWGAVHGCILYSLLNNGTGGRCGEIVGQSCREFVVGQRGASDGIVDFRCKTTGAGGR